MGASIPKVEKLPIRAAWASPARRGPFWVRGGAPPAGWPVKTRIRSSESACHIEPREPALVFRILLAQEPRWGPASHIPFFFPSQQVFGGRGQAAKPSAER